MRMRLLQLLTENRSIRGIVLATGIVYAVCLFISTHIPEPPDLSDLGPDSDKVMHAGAYFLLAILVAASAARWFVQSPRNPWLLFALLLAYAAFDEVSQGPVGRSPEVLDWCADASGLMLGLSAMRVLLQTSRAVADA